ncbi:MAG TPA: N-acetyltransferase [Terriglobales bacterium]|nr:N-acetyltransferase [Terriglobales bacterium]
MRTRNARLPDADAIYELIRSYCEQGVLLPRSLPEICENIRDFVVVEENGRIVGCGALHIYGPHLAEIRSIAVDPAYQGKGAGRKLMEALQREAELHRVSGVCLFTRIPGFFSHLGFAVTAREALPDKLYKDCCSCPKLLCCDEVAMVRGTLPEVAPEPRPFSMLVKLGA